jgi:hypothetical protein
MSNLHSQTDSPDLIRITPEDAASTHVDDLLRRHASLRGERGIARDRARKWYYQNWFVFMIAGTSAALLAYGLIDPYFDEHIYISGVVSAVEMNPTKTLQLQHEETQTELGPDHFITANVGTHPVAFFGGTRWKQPDGKYGDFGAELLKDGQNLGVYTDYAGAGRDDQLLARFVVPNPTKSAENVDIHRFMRQRMVASLMIFPAIAAMIGLFIGAADGVMCRQPRRILLSGFVGLAFGFVGGFLCGVLAELVYSPLTHFASAHWSTYGLGVQIAGRGIAWAFAGIAMGLGQGIALRSKRLILYGFLGGLIGGLLGGLLFDPIDMLILGRDKPSSAVSRWVGFATIGLTVGLAIGLVELLARDAWLRMTEGPLVGKEFLVFKDVMRMGASPKSEIYLFSDPAVAPQHAIIRTTGDIFEIENTCRENPVCVNGRPVTRSRLRHGDRISLGRTSFVFQRQNAQ